MTLASLSQAELAAWNPRMGGVKPAPFPFHSWPHANDPKSQKAVLAALTMQVQANQELLAAYQSC